ncbi:MAG TPA: YciI family protein [Blastocatellia bacterium]|nr:YciI family protein [Blastocatellia bacterium]HMV82948.1 YciI family protein [Blastocatellia bacterium]HMX24633.1 YciI family protein [Blastocatellia bacterium]HMY71962.1 YciI family protein [Blastocatellia bacterium]HMZ21062.1 YciI family protein [Blastocatellia bacterium]
MKLKKIAAMTVLLFVCTVTAFAQLKQAKQESKPEPDHTKMPQFELETYQLGFLRKGPNHGTGTKEEADKIQAGHMANINKMAVDGKLFAAGPMGDNGDLRGIFIFRGISLEEAKALAAADPAIKADRLKLDLFPWMAAPKAIGGKLMEEYKKNPKVSMTMAKHHFVLLKRNAKSMEGSADELQKLQLAHLWNVRRLLDEGKAVAAGPVANAGDLAGIFVFATESMEEAKAWAENDPMVKAGRLTVEIHPWFVAKEVWPK